ncbi:MULTISPECIES: TrkH family potassium uptake protein [Thioclava]|uniref:TrkH family potassium uptake protein n=1 Tax=Thioclava TaxID=285107 RepID=UPI000B54679E|nr:MULTISPECIES: TrkH family potassium uptake protein [Thioclava]OWY11298.1 potassium transporter TrkH [Thioclava sp. F42-5]OWY17693.1 potassium transporter TrkH [Thioclava sp. JM3]WGT51284.1 TrkH family potassium uptake protein [Thioclava nitratireducens]
MNFVSFINGLTLVFFAALMGIDALLFSDTAKVFALSGALVGALGATISVASRSSFLGLGRLHAFLLTSSVWLTAAIAGAVPLAMWSLTPVDALFEAMSGITTTGSTVMSGLDTTPRGIIMWRALLQAVGGVGFIVTGIALLPILKVGGMQLFRTESSDKGDKELSNTAKFASVTLQIYVALIGLCTLAYLAGGMNFFDAVTHAMTTLSTGGYSGYDASFGHFDSPFLQWTATLFMLLGAFPFAWYIRGIYRRTVRSEQVEAMLLTLGVVIIGLTVWLVWTSGTPPLTALRMVAFNVVSVVTTTGYATTDYTVWGPFAVVAFFILSAVGGCTGSTAGGAKAMRWIVFSKAARAQMKVIRLPRRVVSIKYEGRVIENDVLAGVIAFFVIYMATFLGLTTLLGFFGLDFATATSGALTALANVGPGVGPIIGPAGNFSSLSDPVKIILTFGMYLGRLEILTVLVLFKPEFWREIAVLGERA